MLRRDFIKVIGGTVAWPLAVRAQQAERVRFVGVLMDTAEANQEGRTRITAFGQSLHAMGWIEGRNIRIGLRWAGGDVERARRYAEELVGLKPDVIFAFGNAQLHPLSHVTGTIPIVFVGASDPVGAGYVGSFARPGGNITGFILFEPSMAGKWMAMLKEIAPAVSRAAIMVNPDTGMQQGRFYVNEFQKAAAAFKVAATTSIVRSKDDIEQTIAALGQRRDSGLIVAPDGFIQAYDTFIVALTTQHRVPAIYGLNNFAKLGGLASYGPDLVDVARRAAGYVDRILKGEKPADLPVEAPTKYELVINLKAAKLLGIEIAAALLAHADEVVE